LAGAPALLELPTDKPRRAARSFRGAHEKAWLSTALTAELQTLCRQEGATLFMLLLAAWQLLLAERSGQQDIVVGTDLANRNRLETAGLIGLFVNHAALRTDLSGDPTFPELLARVRETALGAYAHQDAPFSQVVAALKPERALQHTPLFQVLFVLQNTLPPVTRLHEVELTPLAFDNHTTKYDLSLFLEENEKGLLGYWVYRTDLFYAETIKHLAAQFETLLQTIVAQPGARLSKLLEPLQEADRRRQGEREKALAAAGLSKLKNIKRKAVRAEEA
jgi:non-ribosomal peptide synthetase component F